MKISNLKNIVRKNLTMLSECYDRLNNHSLISSLKRLTRMEQTAINMFKISIMDSLDKIPIPDLTTIKKAPILYELELTIPSKEHSLTKQAMV